MSGVRVRRAVESDARGIALVHVRSWRVAYRGILPDEVLDGLSVDQRERGWRDRLAERDGRAFTLVPDADGAVAGFCTVATPSRDKDAAPRVAEIEAIYVVPDAWRGGIGTALLDAALEELRARGYQEATLWVLAENERARAFYAACGFEPDGAEKQLEGIGAGVTEVRLRARLTF